MKRAGALGLTVLPGLAELVRLYTVKLVLSLFWKWTLNTLNKILDFIPLVLVSTSSLVTSWD